MSKQRQELDTVKHTTELDSKLLTDVRNSIVVIRDMPVIATILLRTSVRSLQ